jgi:hypothetical protein
LWVLLVCIASLLMAYVMRNPYHHLILLSLEHWWYTMAKCARTRFLLPRRSYVIRGMRWRQRHVVIEP